MRHNEPDFMVEYRNGPPKCCHSCEHYSQKGICEHFNMEPPEDFAASIGACPDFVGAVPF